jgi:hypothetical protein
LPAKPLDAAEHPRMMSPEYSQQSSSDILMTPFSLWQSHISHIQKNISKLKNNSLDFLRSEFESGVIIKFRNISSKDYHSLHKLKNTAFIQQLTYSADKCISHYGIRGSSCRPVQFQLTSSQSTYLESTLISSLHLHVDLSNKILRAFLVSPIPVCNIFAYLNLVNLFLQQHLVRGTRSKLPCYTIFSNFQLQHLSYDYLAFFSQIPTIYTVPLSKTQEFTII